MTDPSIDPEGRRRKERRRIIHKATAYTVGFIAATLVVSVGGAALVAFLLSVTGFPFLETWAVLVALLLLVPIGLHVIGAIRRRGRTDDG